MRISTIKVYRDLLSSMSQFEFSSLKTRVLRDRVYFKELDLDEIVCPVAEEVFDRSRCDSCCLVDVCPNFNHD